MRKQLDTLREVKEFLDRHDIRHLVIGGVANAVWGRVTVNMDKTRVSCFDRGMWGRAMCDRVERITLRR